MFPWLWVWAPHVNYPWSGSVAQRIEPDTRWFFNAIHADAGDARVEREAFEVASYGRQLGLLAEVLIDVAQQQATLSDAASASLARLKDIQRRIEDVKDRRSSDLAREVEVQVRQLRERDPAAFAALGARLRPLLNEGAP